MNLSDIRQKFIDYYKEKDHKVIDSYPLLPKDDPTTLFVGSGMQPMLEYFLGKPHPTGAKRIVDSQKCFRGVDIDEVGDNRHTTFFEMLGNWSFGDYWKEEQLRWIFEFLVDELGLDPRRLYISVFIGDEKSGLPKDTESVEIWKKLFAEKGIDAKAVEIGSGEEGSKEGMRDGRIFYYDAEKNWWSRQGAPEKMPIGEPGGPDSEIFYEFDQDHDLSFGEKCHPNCECGKYLEIANSVFMEFKKVGEGEFESLPEKNVDFGGGLERMAMATSKSTDIFEIPSFKNVIRFLEGETGKAYEDNKSEMRIIADHLRAATFMIVEGVVPSNKMQGYTLRSLIRRSAVKVYELGSSTHPNELFTEICKFYINSYGELYFDIEEDKKKVEDVVNIELDKFTKSLEKGLKQIEKADISEIDGDFAFDLYQTYGFPFEITKEILNEKGFELSREMFDGAEKEHRKLSRQQSAGSFKGGLGDKSKETIWYHTCTHLLHEALRQVLGDHVKQEGSNITSERLRFDFSHQEAMTDDEITKVEEIVNKKIDEGLDVTFETMSLQQALDSGALAFFADRYNDDVDVYSIGEFSKEVCGGPHVENTSEIEGKFKIVKEKSSGAGIRRIRAVIE